MKTDTTINGRMPQTIKKRIGCWNAFRQRKCPAAKDITFKEPGACKNCALRVQSYTVEQATVDILEYVEQLERERDAAVEQLTETSNKIGSCKGCVHYTNPGYKCYLWEANENCYEWCGVQEVE